MCIGVGMSEIARKVNDRGRAAMLQIFHFQARSITVDFNPRAQAIAAHLAADPKLTILNEDAAPVFGPANNS
jgi:hypothetical protein